MISTSLSVFKHKTLKEIWTFETASANRPYKHQNQLLTLKERTAKKCRGIHLPV